MKKFVIAVVSLLLILVIGAAVAFWQISTTSGGSLEKWIGKQLQSVANSYLGPTLSFDGLDYQYPGTVKLKNMRLTAEDPMNPGKTIDVLGTTDATITLGEIPSVGKPIVITKVILNQPLFQAVSISPTNRDLVGFAHFLKPGVVKPDGATTQPSHKLSDFFQVQQIQLNDCKVVYDPRIAGTDPMVLDHIWTEVDITPTSGNTYDLALGLNRKPLFDLKVGGQFNVDTLVVSNADIKLVVAVDPAQMSYLPPEMQALVKKYQVQGQLSVHVAGSLPVKDYKNGNVDLNVRLTNANVTTDEYKIPVRALVLDSQLEDGKVVISSLSIKALKGLAEASGTVDVNRRLDSDLQLHVHDVVIDEFFVKPGTAEKPKLAGRLKANLHTEVSLSAIMVRLAPDSATGLELASKAPELLDPLPEKWGSGEIHLDHGRLVNIPVLEQLTRAITKTASLLSSKRKDKPTETADATFDFMGDQIKISDFNYAGEIVAARGDGAIALDERLDLTFNGGPIEKIQNLLGKKIGSILGSVTDQVFSYRVTGTVDEPKIGIIVAGGVQDVAGDITQGAGKVGKSIGNGAKGILKGILGL